MTLDELFKLANQGNPEAQYELSLRLQAKDDSIEEGIDWLQRSANNGYPPAEYLYSLFCEGGIAGDPADAFMFCLRAARHGYCPAAKRAGSMLEHGIGVAKNLEQAFHWYNRAAELGDVDSAARIGRMYAEGAGVEKDDAKAMEWFLEGQKRGSPWALYALSSVYRFGELDQSVDSKRADELGDQAVSLLKERTEKGQAVLKKPAQ